MNWYVIMAYSGYELKVKAAIEERIALAGLEDQFGEILVPTESVVELKSGAKKKTERKFFPGYILIEMEMNDDTWQLVKHTPRVSTFVGGKKDKPSSISKSDVDNILNRMVVGEEAPRPKTLFEPGEVIRVCDVLLMILMASLKMLIMREAWSKSQCKSLVDQLLFN